MPNWVKNKLDVKGEDKQQINEVIELFKDGVSFDKIIPMPEELKGTKSPADNPDSPENKALIKKYGACEWYTWAWDNWGTKWDACDEETTEPLHYIFNTAWSMPNNFYLELSKKFDKLEFVVTYADENAGYNFGRVTYKNGTGKNHPRPTEGSKEATDFADRLWGWAEEDS